MAISTLNAVQDEGDNGTTAFTFTVTRSGDVSGPTDVNFAVTGTGAIPANPADFGGSFQSGTVNFSAMDTTQIVTVDVFGDTDDEFDEEFTITLSGPTNGAQITSGSAIGLIQNDDANFSIAPLAATEAEGDSGTIMFTFTVTRTGDTSTTQTVNYVVKGDGVFPADAADFGGAFPSGSVIFAPNDVSQIISVNVTGDVDIEQDENFSVFIAPPISGTNPPFLSDPSLGVLELVAGKISDLNEIDGLAFDSFGNLFGALEINGSGGGVVYIDTTTGLVTTLINNISRADQIAFDPASGSLYLTSEELPGSVTDRVFRLDPVYDINNVPVSLTATSITTSLSIDNPEGLVVLEATGAYGSVGDLIVAEDLSAGEIVHLSPPAPTLPPAPSSSMNWSLWKDLKDSPSVISAAPLHPPCMLRKLRTTTFSTSRQME